MKIAVKTAAVNFCSSCGRNVFLVVLGGAKNYKFNDVVLNLQVSSNFDEKVFHIVDQMC